MSRSWCSHERAHPRAWQLAFPERLPDGSWRVHSVHGSRCRARDDALTLLSDRRANGEAFDGEFVQAPIADVAPELLAALRPLADYLEDGDAEEDSDLARWLRAARAAIAKAQS